MSVLNGVTFSLYLLVGAACICIIGVTAYLVYNKLKQWLLDRMFGL